MSTPVSDARAASFRPASVRSTVVVIAFLAAATAACGGKQLDMTIPVEDARALNSEVSARYVRTRTLLEDATHDARTIGLLPDELPADDLDVDLLRHVMEACFSQGVSHVRDVDLEQVPRAARAELGEPHEPLTARPPVGRALACDPARMLALETYLDVVDPEIADFMSGRVLLVDELRVDLKDVLEAQLDDLERTVASANAELVELRETSAERRALAQTSDMPPDDKRRVEIDYETITQELDQIEAVLGQISGELTSMRQLRRQLVDEAARSIAEFGTQG